MDIDPVEQLHARVLNLGTSIKNLWEARMKDSSLMKDLQKRVKYLEYSSVYHQKTPSTALRPTSTEPEDSQGTEPSSRGDVQRMILGLIQKTTIEWSSKDCSMVSCDELTDVLTMLRVILKKNS